jgi:hypothetical protein
MAAFGRLPAGLHGMREISDLANGYFSFSGSQTGVWHGTGVPLVAPDVFDLLVESVRADASGSRRNFLNGAAGLPLSALADFAGKPSR